jgi:hypothetical protein
MLQIKVVDAYVIFILYQISRLLRRVVFEKVNFNSSFKYALLHWSYVEPVDRWVLTYGDGVRTRDKIGL